MVLALALSACSGRTAKDELAGNYCPSPFTVQDAQNLTRFKAGPGRDPRDVAFEATLVGAATTCAIGKGQLKVDLFLRIAANAGPSVGAGVSSVPFFVRLIDGRGAVVQGQEFTADFRLSQTNPRGQSQEELSLVLPYDQPADLGGYRLAVGLKPTQEELQYNRRAAAR